MQFGSRQLIPVGQGTCKKKPRDENILSAADISSTSSHTRESCKKSGHNCRCRAELWGKVATCKSWHGLGLESCRTLGLAHWRGTGGCIFTPKSSAKLKQVFD